MRRQIAEEIARTTIFVSDTERENFLLCAVSERADMRAAALRAAAVRGATALQLIRLQAALAAQTPACDA